MSEKITFESWAVVELFGHNMIAGLVTEQSIGGGTFVRVDVPEVDEDHPAFTKFFGDKAIYAISPTTEEVARAAAARIRVKPIQPYVLPAANRQLVDSYADDDDDEYERPEF